MPMGTSASQVSSHLSKEQWLEVALDTLSHAGRSRLHLDSLISAMPVTKGSFYHHFSGKSEFLHALVTYWKEEFTDRLIAFIGEPDDAESAKQILWKFMAAVVSHDMAQYESTMRCLALECQSLSDLVAETKAIRYRYANGIFSKMGFRGPDLETRTQAFIALMERQLFEESVPKDLLKARRRDYFDFLTRL